MQEANITRINNDARTSSPEPDTTGSGSHLCCCIREQQRETGAQDQLLTLGGQAREEQVSKTSQFK